MKMNVVNYAPQTERDRDTAALGERVDWLTAALLTLAETTQREVAATLFGQQVSMGHMALSEVPEGIRAAAAQAREMI